MRRLFLPVLLGASVLLSACEALVPVGLSMVAGIGSQNALESGAAKNRANRCYDVEVAARKTSKDPAYIRKELTAARCPLN